MAKNSSHLCKPALGQLWISWKGKIYMRHYKLALWQCCIDVKILLILQISRAPHCISNRTNLFSFASVLWPTQHGSTSLHIIQQSSAFRTVPSFCVTIHPLKSPQVPKISPRTCLQFKYMCFTASKRVITKSLFRVFSVKRGHQFSKKYSLLHIHSRPASSSQSSDHTPDGAFVVFFCHK